MRHDQLTIDIVWDGASVTLRLSGEIDMCTAELVREAALAAIDQGHTDVHIDMSAVTFMDSTGLNMLRTRQNCFIFDHQRHGYQHFELSIQRGSQDLPGCPARAS